MVSTSSELPAGAGPGTDTAPRYLPGTTKYAVKVVIAGGFGVGKTTFVGSTSDIRPLRTEEVMTAAGVPVDSLPQASTKTTTTVGTDFGRIQVDDELVLYLFGTPGQDRFAFVWDALLTGTAGALVLVDTRYLDQAFTAIDRLEERGIPYIVACNGFPGSKTYDDATLRKHLDLAADTPLTHCDARDRGSAVAALRTLITYLLSLYA
jgi:signal recognition particle receptor subunit beta